MEIVRAGFEQLISLGEGVGGEEEHVKIRMELMNANS